MRQLTLLLLLTGTCLAGDPPPEEVKKELKLFQGTWTALAVHDYPGERLPQEKIKTIRLMVDGDKFVLTQEGGPDISGKFTIDPTKKPRTIDVFLSGDSGTGPSVRGIYEMTGDMRKSCFGFLGKERPTEFKKEKDFLYLEWKRAK